MNKATPFGYIENGDDEVFSNALKLLSAVPEIWVS